MKKKLIILLVILMVVFFFGCDVSGELSLQEDIDDFVVETFSEQARGSSGSQLSYNTIATKTNNTIWRGEIYPDELIGGLATSVSTGWLNQTWVVGLGGSIWKLSATLGWVNKNIYINGQYIYASEIGVGRFGTAWVVGQNSHIYEYVNGVWFERPGTNWKRVDVKDNIAYALDKNGFAYEYRPNGSWHLLANGNGPQGNIVDIGCSYLLGLLLDSSGKLYVYDDIIDVIWSLDISLPNGKTGNRVDAGRNGYIATDTDGNAYYIPDLFSQFGDVIFTGTCDISIIN